MPRKRLKPTEDERRKVRTLSACGIEPDDIAKYVGVSEKTLQEILREGDLPSEGGSQRQGRQGAF